MAGIEHHSQTNGLDERMNQTVTKAIVKYLIPEQDNWDEHIDAISLSHKYTCINKLYTILLDVWQGSRFPVELQMTDQTVESCMWIVIECNRMLHT